MKSQGSNLLTTMVRGMILLSFFMPLSIFSQEPVWLDVNVRNMQYPQDAYYTGFSEVYVTSSKTKEQALNSAKQKAVGELSDRVRVMVNSKKLSINTSYGGTDVEEQIRSKFTSLVETTSQTEVVGSKVYTYYAEKDKTVYAFAYVSREELKNYYKNQISLYLNKVEGTLATASELAEKGYKNKARQQCLSVVDAFATIAYSQDLLTAMEEHMDDSSLQQSRSERLRNELIQTIADLENSVYVYLECNETVNGQSVVHIGERLPGMITEKGCGCNFTEMEEEADFVVRVNARLSRCQDAPDNIVFCYANATLSIFNKHTQKTVKPKISEAKGGWTQGNKANATEEAFDELAEKIVEKVVPALKN